MTPGIVWLVLVCALAQVPDPGIVLQEGSSTIMGRVLDVAGQPLPGALVTALRRASAGKSPLPLIPIGETAQTNDAGDFRLSGLPPGEYDVLAGPALGSPLQAPVTAAAAVAPTFYPGTADASAARPVAIGDGQTVSNIVVRLVSMRGFQLSGMVVDEPGRPVADVMIILKQSPRASVVTPWPIGQARTDRFGRFVIGNVPRGIYTIIATVPVTLDGQFDGRAQVQRIPPPTQLEVTVDNADVSDLRAVVRP